jgi:hypothetical protein
MAGALGRSDRVRRYSGLFRLSDIICYDNRPCDYDDEIDDSAMRRLFERLLRFQLYLAPGLFKSWQLCGIPLYGLHDMALLALSCF